MTDSPERIWACIEPDWHSGETGEPLIGGNWEDHDFSGSGAKYIRADLVAELVEALRAAHEALLWCARDGRMASPLLHQYPAKWAAEVGAKLAKLEGGE